MIKNDFFKTDVNFGRLRTRKYDSDEAKERVNSKRNFRGLFK